VKDVDLAEQRGLSWEADLFLSIDSLPPFPFPLLVGRRRVLVFPHGNASPQPLQGVISIYLDLADPEEASKDWHICVQFALAMSSPRDPSVFTVSRSSSPNLIVYRSKSESANEQLQSHVLTVGSVPTDAHHRFTASERDWGFTRFAQTRGLQSA
jgi:ubiquitin carboxyl-terminal hydrolase 7